MSGGATVEELHRAAVEPGRLLVVETSSAYPRTRGLPPEHPHSLALDEIDVWVESDAAPRTLDDAAPGEIEQAMHGISAKLYEAAAAEAATEGDEGDGSISVEDDVVDADFEVVDED